MHGSYSREITTESTARRQDRSGREMATMYKIVILRDGKPEAPPIHAEPKSKSDAHFHGYDLKLSLQAANKRQKIEYRIEPISQ